MDGIFLFLLTYQFLDELFLLDSAADHIVDDVCGYCWLSCLVQYLYENGPHQDLVELGVAVAEDAPDLENRQSVTGSLLIADVLLVLQQFQDSFFNTVDDCWIKDP